MARGAGTARLEDLSPVEVYPYAVRFTARWHPDDVHYYRRYTTLSAAKAAANHKVADKPTTIFTYDPNGFWAETEIKYE